MKRVLFLACAIIAVCINHSVVGMVGAQIPVCRDKTCIKILGNRCTITDPNATVADDDFLNFIAQKVQNRVQCTRLIFKNCSNLQAVSAINMPKFESVKVENCPQLTRLELQHVCSIEFIGCGTLEEICAPCVTEADIAFCGPLTKLILPNVQSVRAQNCSLPPDVVLEHANSIAIVYCTNLKTLCAPQAREIEVLGSLLEDLNAPQLKKLHENANAVLREIIAPKLETATIGSFDLNKFFAMFPGVDFISCSASRSRGAPCALGVLTDPVQIPVDRWYETIGLLDLSDAGITEIKPESFDKLAQGRPYSSLVSIAFDDNKELHELPSSIAQLSRLRAISLRRTGVQRWEDIAVLKQMRSIKRICLLQTPLAQQPDWSERACWLMNRDMQDREVAIIPATGQALPEHFISKYSLLSCFDEEMGELNLRCLPREGLEIMGTQEAIGLAFWADERVQRSIEKNGGIRVFLTRNKQLTDLPRWLVFLPIIQLDMAGTGVTQDSRNLRVFLHQHRTGCLVNLVATPLTSDSGAWVPLRDRIRSCRAASRLSALTILEAMESVCDWAEAASARAVASEPVFGELSEHDKDVIRAAIKEREPAATPARVEALVPAIVARIAHDDAIARAKRKIAGGLITFIRDLFGVAHGVKRALPDDEPSGEEPSDVAAAEPATNRRRLDSVDFSLPFLFDADGGVPESKSFEPEDMMR